MLITEKYSKMNIIDLDSNEETEQCYNQIPKLLSEVQPFEEQCQHFNLKKQQKQTNEPAIHPFDYQNDKINEQDIYECYELIKSFIWNKKIDRVLTTLKRDFLYNLKRKNRRIRRERAQIAIKNGQNGLSQNQQMENSIIFDESDENNEGYRRTQNGDNLSKNSNAEQLQELEQDWNSDSQINLKQDFQELQQTRNNMKMHIAKSFVEKGYGFTIFRRYLDENNLQYDFTLYKPLCCTLVNQVVRYLENYILHEVKFQMEPMAATQIKWLYKYLLNCRRKLEKTDSQTFLLFVCKCYGINEVSIEKNEALSLYLRLDTIIRKKKQNQQDEEDYVPIRRRRRYKTENQISNSYSKNGSRGYALSKMKVEVPKWSQTIFNQLIRFHSRMKNAFRITSQMKNRYQDIQINQQIVIAALGKLHKMYVRKLKLHSIKHQNSCPKMAGITSQNLNYLITIPIEDNLRVGLSTLIESRFRDFQLVKDIILAYNLFSITIKRNGNPPIKRRRRRRTTITYA